MSTVCIHCKPQLTKTFPTRRIFPKSTVIESRRKPAHTTVKGKIVRTWTIMRRRLCLGCGWRWKTIEISMTPKHRSGNPKWKANGKR